MSKITPGDGDPRHGTMNGYGNLKCRCDSCRAAASAYQHARVDRNREWSNRTARHLPREDYLELVRAEHGSERKYKLGCRCDACRAGAAAKRRERRLRGFVQTHSAAGYKNGCRCSVCREAANEYQRLKAAAEPVTLTGT